MRLVSGTLLPGLLRWLLLVHLRLLISLRWWRVLPWLLLLLWWVLRLVSVAVLWKWLTIGAVELSVWWWPLTAPDSVSRDEGLCLSMHRSEDAFLGKAHAVGAAAILGLIEAGTSNLEPRVSTL